MKVKLLTDGNYAFAEGLVGQEFEAECFGAGYTVFIPEALSHNNDTDNEWTFFHHEVEVLDDN
jgi:hypothetical protein